MISAFRLVPRGMPSASMGGLGAQVGRYLEGFNRVGDAPPDIHAVAIADPAVFFLAVHGFEQRTAAMLADEEIGRAVYVDLGNHDFDSRSCMAFSASLRTSVHPFSRWSGFHESGNWALPSAHQFLKSSIRAWDRAFARCHLDRYLS